MNILDYEVLEVELKTLKPRTKLFKLLKEYLCIYGYWKNKARGNPKKGYEVSKTTPTNNS